MLLGYNYVNRSASGSYDVAAISARIFVKSASSKIPSIGGPWISMYRMYSYLIATFTDVSISAKIIPFCGTLLAFSSRASNCSFSLDDIVYNLSTKVLRNVVVDGQQQFVVVVDEFVAGILSASCGEVASAV